MESLEIHAGERANSGLCLASGGRLDVDVGDVADICVTGKEREPRDVEVFEDELSLVILILGPICTLSAHATRPSKRAVTIEDSRFT